MSGTQATSPKRGAGNVVYWTMRAAETGLLLAALVGMGLFAWSLVDIVRIETAAVPTKDIPPSAWPGIFIFLGAMVLLQVVRVVLGRYRRDDGTPLNDARGSAVTTTAEVLAGLEEPPVTDMRTDTETGV